MRWWAGFLSGLIVMSAAVLVALAALWIPDAATAYKDFKSELPAATSLALWPAVYWGLPLVLVGLTYVANVVLPERIRVVALGIVALLAVASVPAIVWAVMLPIQRLAGEIAV